MNERDNLTIENMVTLREMSRLCRVLNTDMNHSVYGVAIFEATELQHHITRYLSRTVEILGETDAK